MPLTISGIIDTLIGALRKLRGSRAYRKALALRGKIVLEVDLERSRERPRR